MATFVYKSTDYGAPSSVANAGQSVAILEACLVTGYGSLNLLSLTRVGNLVTAITSADHGYSTIMPAHLTISGSLDPAYNGAFTCTITSPNSFTYTISGTPNSPASGTLSVKRSPAGWTKEFVGTNSAAFKQPAGSNGFYLRMIDTGSTSGTYFRGYETMTDIDTGTGLFPSTAQLGGDGGNLWRGNYPWTLIAVNNIFHFIIHNPWSCGMCFGDIKSFKIGDAYHTILIEGGSTSYLERPDASYSYRYMARSYTQVGGSILMAMTSDRICSSYSGYNSGYPFPEPVTGGVLLAPIYISEQVGARRGVIPGCWAILHNLPMTNYDTFYGSGELAGKIFLYVQTGAGSLAFEVSDVS